MRHKWIECLLLLVLTISGCGPHKVQRDAQAPVEEWPNYGNDPGSSRHSPLTEITKDNVQYLKVAWVYHTGDLSYGNSTWNGKKVWAKSTFEATPLFVDGTLFVVSSFNRIIALDPETGREKWTFDPKLDRIGWYGDAFTCRGLATWVDPQRQPGEMCHRTIYVAALEGRLVAVDSEGRGPCPAFGTNGEVALTAGINIPIKGEYHWV